RSGGGPRRAVGRGLLQRVMGVLAGAVPVVVVAAGGGLQVVGGARLWCHAGRGSLVTLQGVRSATGHRGAGGDLDRLVGDVRGRRGLGDRRSRERAAERIAAWVGRS